MRFQYAVLVIPALCMGCSIGPRDGTAVATQPAVDRPKDSPVFADPGDRRRIVYVFDESAAMLQKFSTPKMELFRAITQLREDQSFAVVLYTNGANVRVMSQSLMPATGENKRLAAAFLEEGSLKGEADPRPALRLAFQMNPDLVYFFSADDFDTAEPYGPIGEEIAQLNPAHRVKVHTILFDVHKERLDLKAAMRKIAADNGGTFRDWDEW